MVENTTLVVAVVCGFLGVLLQEQVCDFPYTILKILCHVPNVAMLDDPLFQTGNTYLDVALGILLFGVTLLVLLDAIGHLWQMASEAAEEERRFPEYASGIKWGAFKALVLAAIVITILVNVLRYEHRQLKLQFFQQLMRDGGGSGEFVPIPWRFVQALPDFLKGWADTGPHRHFYSSVPQPLQDQFPWVPTTDASRVTSVWGYFKLLVENSRGLWWTRQWSWAGLHGQSSSGLRVSLAGPCVCIKSAYGYLLTMW